MAELELDHAYLSEIARFAQIARLRAVNAKLLEALEDVIDHVDRFHGEAGYPGNRCEWCVSVESRAREAIEEARK
jgi:hypothetical protein